MEELLTTALVLDRNPRRRTDRLAVLTDGGGFAVLAADEWEALGRRSATVTGPTVRALRGFLPSYCSVGNPTDVGGDSDSNPEVIGRAAATLLNDPGVGSLLLTGIVGGYGEAFNSEFVAHERRAVQAIYSGWRHSGKPLLVHSLWELADSPVLAELADSGVAVVRSLQAGLRALAHLDGYARRVGAARQPRRIRRHPRLLVPEATDEASLYRFLGQAGLTVPNNVVIDDETAAPMAAARIGYPLVAKALVPGLAHKSELGAVRVGIGSSEELLRHVRELRELSDEVLLVQMLRSPVELLLGGLRSEQFGLLVSVGVGGLLAEAVAETVFLRAPLTKSEVVEALARSPVISRVLATQRRGRPVARGKLIRAVLCVADLMSSSPQIASLEINPLMLDEDHAWVADAKLRLASRGMGRADPG